MALWRAYFGENAFIIGADFYNESVRIEGVQRFGRPNKIVIGDQGSEVFWRRLEAALPGGRLDILIDDGSHKAEHMQMSMERSLALLRPGGVYACEDIHGTEHGFMRYLFNEYMYSNSPHATLHFHQPQGTRATAPQRDVFALSMYPYLVVVEKMIEPRTRISTFGRGQGGINGSRHNWLTGGRSSHRPLGGPAASPGATATATPAPARWGWLTGRSDPKR